MKTNQWILNYYILLRLKEYNSNIITVIGGIESSDQGKEYLRIFKKADFAIWGEGEVPFIELLNNLDNPSYYDSIPQLVYRKKNKIITTTPIKPKNLPDINKFPFANHDDYFKQIKKLKLHLASPIRIPIWGVRSCFWNQCKFCSLNEGYTYNERSPENIVQEIEYQSKKHNVDHFIFADTDFGRKNKNDFYRLLELLLESTKNHGKLYYIIGDISPLRIDRKSVKLMKKIGFEGVQIGFEAAADSILHKLSKKQRFIHNIQAIKLADEGNFYLSGLNVIRNIPTETEEDVIQSIKNLKYLRFQMHKTPLKLVMLNILKRSPFFEEITEKQKMEWSVNLNWQELKKIDFLSTADRFEFFGFYKTNLLNPYLWNIFDIILNRYRSLEISYNWIEQSDGTSIFKEQGTYYLDKTETDILKYCDTIKTKSEIIEQFPKIKQETLFEMLESLKNVGLIYIDKDFKQMISIPSTYKIQKSKK